MNMDELKEAIALKTRHEQWQIYRFLHNALDHRMDREPPRE